MSRRARWFVERYPDLKLRASRSKHGDVGWTCARFIQEVWEDGKKVGESTHYPYVQRDEKTGRPAMRISLGMRELKDGEKGRRKGDPKRVPLKAYLSTILGFAYNTTFESDDPERPLDDFMDQGWEGDHLVDLDTMEVPCGSAAGLFRVLRALLLGIRSGCR